LGAARSGNLRDPTAIDPRSTADLGDPISKTPRRMNAQHRAARPDPAA
jgi:hypothetical protein